MIFIPAVLLGLSIALVDDEPKEAGRDLAVEKLEAIDLLDPDLDSLIGDDFGKVELVVLKGRKSIQPGNARRSLTVGERFRIELTPKQKGYIYIFTKGESGKHSLIFPNEVPEETAARQSALDDAARIQEGETVAVPKHPYYITAKHPVGTERLSVIFTEEPLNQAVVVKLMQDQEYHAKLLNDLKAKMSGKTKHAAGDKSSKKRGIGEGAGNKPPPGPQMSNAIVLEFQLETKVE